MSAEENPQTVTGAVTDPDGNPLEGVVCVLKRQSDNATFETTTDANGNYSFTGLPNGTYHGVVRYEDSRGNLYTSTNKPNIEVIGELPIKEIYYQRNYSFSDSFRSLDKDDYSENWTINQTVSGDAFIPMSDWCTENGSIYIFFLNEATNEDVLYSIDSSDGTINWTYTISGGFSGTGPRVIDGVIFTANQQEQILAIQDNGDSATQKWVFDLDFGFGGDTPSYGDGSLYVYTNGSLWSIDATDGTEEWEVNVQDPAMEQIPVYYNGTLYTVEETAVRARDPTNGSVIWSQTIDADSSHAPAVTDDAVYVQEFSGAVTSIESSTGNENWSTDIGGQTFRGGPVVYDGVVYSQNSGSGLNAINAADGSVNWTYSFNPRSGLAITGDVDGVVINTVDGSANVHEVGLDGVGEVVYESGGSFATAGHIGAADGWSVSNMPGRIGNTEPIAPWWEKFL